MRERQKIAKSFFLLFLPSPSKFSSNPRRLKEDFRNGNKKPGTERLYSILRAKQKSFKNPLNL